MSVVDFRSSRRRNRVPLTVALPPYAHAYELVAGDVDLAGIEPTFVELPSPSLAGDGEGGDYDVTDVPLLDYATRRLDGDRTLTAVPVFTSRGFAHGSVGVRSVAAPENLRAARIGTDWGDTASVYVRGMLADLYGIDPSAVQWSDDGEPDAVIAPWSRLPPGYTRLFDPAGDSERDYYQRTGVFPILRVLVVRSDVLDAHRPLASNLYRAFEVARRRYYARAGDIRASRVPIPSLAAHVDRLRAFFGGDIAPYGVEPNRVTLEAFVRYAAEQGIVERVPGDVAELFAPVEPFVDYTDGV